APARPSRPGLAGPRPDQRPCRPVQCRRRRGARRTPGDAMNGLPADARRDLPLALVAAATTWVTTLSWRGFSSLWGQYLGPLLFVAPLVAVGGVLFRSAPLPRRLALLLHVLVVALVVWLMMGGSLIHPIHGAHHVGDALADA